MTRNKTNLIIGFTGHRKLSHPPYAIRNTLHQIFDFLQNERGHKIVSVVSGFAIGFDLQAAYMASEKGIPILAALPFDGHGTENSRYWTDEQRAMHKDLLVKADKSVVVSPGGYEKWKYYARNKYIVDWSDVLIAYCSDEENGKSGTNLTVSYAKSKGGKVKNIFNMISSS